MNEACLDISLDENDMTISEERVIANEFTGV